MRIAASEPQVGGSRRARAPERTQRPDARHRPLRRERAARKPSRVLVEPCHRGAPIAAAQRGARLREQRDFGRQIIGVRWGGR